MSRIGKIIKNSREESDYSQNKLGTYLGYTCGQFVSNWERGISTPPLQLARELCTLLKIDIKEYKKALIKDYTEKVNKVV